MQPIKRKRGRKSKKELTESFNNITIHVDEPAVEQLQGEPTVTFENLFKEIQDENEITRINQEQDNKDDKDEKFEKERDGIDNITNLFSLSEEPKVLSKKRGRKPKPKPISTPPTITIIKNVVLSFD